jgi:hypothetical protein
MIMRLLEQNYTLTEANMARGRGFVGRSLPPPPAQINYQGIIQRFFNVALRRQDFIA